MRLSSWVWILVLTCVLSQPTWAWPEVAANQTQWNKGAGCTPLPDSGDTGILYDVSFEGDIRASLNTLCLNCHINSASGGLNMNTSNARLHLIGPDEAGAPSTGSPSLLRVKPFKPLESVLFLKLNCDAPPAGSRMPLGGTAPSALQALVYDWIASGALMPDSPNGDRTFVGNFESIVRP